LANGIQLAKAFLPTISDDHLEGQATTNYYTNPSWKFHNALKTYEQSYSLVRVPHLFFY